MTSLSGLTPPLRIHHVDRAAALLIRSEQPETWGFAEPPEATFDRLAIPDGAPFVLEFDGSSSGCADLNRYLFAAIRHRAMTVGTARTSSIYNLVRFVRFLRRRRAEASASEFGINVEEWLEVHGWPSTALSDATTADLVAYRDHRRASTAPRTWNSELSTLSGYFEWAVQAGLIEQSPVPRWGSRQRSTLKVREEIMIAPRYLTEPQLRAFLTRGLRGDGLEAPRMAERNYAFGLALVSTGLRRVECANLLDLEVVRAIHLPEDGVAEFVRVGKGGRPRRIYITYELALAIDVYRDTTRRHLVESAQPSLRKRVREGRVEIVDEVVTDKRGQSAVLIAGQRVPLDRLSDEQRAKLVVRQPDGRIEPLALFVSERGVALNLGTWNKIFNVAELQLRSSTSPDKPPPHIEVTPHTMRHTFAVRMLAALMRLGRDRASNPYYLLASPTITVQQLLGHSSPTTTQRYLVAAEKYDDALPVALRQHVASAIGEVE